MSQDDRVKDIGEDALISRLMRDQSPGPDVIVGPGDDCAVIDSNPESAVLELLKTDCVVESVHFQPGTDPQRVGWKAMCRTISDIAAMGGSPCHALVTIAIDSERTVSELEGWYRGMRKAASQFGGFSIVGGETTRLPVKGAVISIALTGKVERNRQITRSGANVGDRILVTGRLGGSFASGRHLDFTPRLFEAKWLAAQEPELRPSAMMDLSDGLSKDLPRMADMSGIPGYQIELPDIPVHENSDLASAIGEGEDYELLFTIPPTAADRLLRNWKEQFPACPLSIIGTMNQSPERTPLEGGWEHFEP